MNCVKIEYLTGKTIMARKAAKFRIQTDDVTLERRTTQFQAIRLATESSIFCGCDITVDRELDCVAANQLNLNPWLRIGYAIDGKFFRVH